MDRELPAKIWVPVLLAAALIPVAIFAPLIMRAVISYGTLGAGCYFAFRALKAGRGKWHAAGCMIGALSVGGLVMMLLYPPTHEELAAASRAEQAEAQAQAQQRREAQAQCSPPSADQRAAYRELKERMADGTLTSTEYYAAKRSISNFEVYLAGC